MANERTALVGKRVLLVEDEYFIAADLKAALRDAGASVVGPFPEVELAKPWIAKARPHAAVLDINLCGDMSYPIADELTERGVPFMFLTGHSGDYLPPDYRRAPRVTKPAKNREVILMLSEMVGDPAPTTD